MLKSLAAVCGLLLLPICDVAVAATCTLVVNAADGRLLHESGDCASRNSPASTFKLPLAVMGFDAGILKDPHKPVWSYRQEYRASREEARKATDPSYWLMESIVWYSQQLTLKLGMPAFRRYVDGFDYGNRDLSGDPGRKNGLTQAWLGHSSLQISPREQVVFLRRLLDRALPVSRTAQDKAIASLPVFTAMDGWAVRGKTGSGYQRGPGGNVDRTQPFGWFVGWAEKPGRDAVVFARLRKLDSGPAMGAGPQTRDSLLADLPKLAGN
ncbi:class D beta-lactamase [Ferrovibrio terrae]|uniref:class D beta-lactamase n=1 Tax=Ferrovibrio terrae TaxID=2594003 RepID=UPI0031378CBE